MVSAGCAPAVGPVVTPAAPGYPLTVRNCDRDVVIDAPPQRAVSLNQSSTEILLSLGLADRMVGTATWTDPVRFNLEAENARVPRLAVNKPSLETVLDTEPDFVSASFGGTLGPGGVADRDQFAELGVPTYLLAEEGADIILFDICHDIETNEYALATSRDLEEAGLEVEKTGR
ncbi:ABC transporter substrate-binding protein, partial [Mycolicibacterium porcinum]|uniref:ABC transporter substrate-binding protein n=1 Tax=Mycolicibacterium porcinum TaxID=39693 RepID=UPI00256EB4EE